MNYVPQLLLVAAVIGVGVLHTLVPDHWAPIMLLARQRAWSRRETARAALIAGTGHAFSTLVIGVLVWLAGVALARHFGEIASLVSGLLLIAFGTWMALAAWRELRGSGGHRHDHETDGAAGHPERAPPQRGHRHRTSGRMTLLLILGSSPMVEGIPAFFAAGKYGPGLIVVMGLCFAASTIATYVVVCVYSTAGLQRLHFGALERYGEVMSGALIAVIGLVFTVWSLV